MASGKAHPNEAGGKKPSKRARADKGAKHDLDDLDEFFVDPAPAPGEGKKSGRAADRRRERGQAPVPAGAPDTRMSLRQRDPPSAPAHSAHSARPSRAATPAIGTLTCTRGPEEGVTLQLTEGSYTIGRARENAFVLKDIAASRRHLRIDVDGRGARLVDLGSGNGSRLNGRRVSEAELRHGDRIEIGGSVLVFSDAGRPAPAEDPLTDDAQDRVIRAAEKLAAELSDRMRAASDAESDFGDGHVARTQALPKSDKKAVVQELKKQADQQQGKKLWNETFSNIALNEIVPANDPLRGARAAHQPAAAEAYVPPPRPAPHAPQTRPAGPPPRPAYDGASEVSSSRSRGGGGSFMLPLLVTALVVILGGAAVLGFWWVTQKEGKVLQAEAGQYEAAMDGAERSMLQDDWAQVKEYAALALQYRPGDASAKRYLEKARDKLSTPLPPATGEPDVVQAQAAQPASAQLTAAQPAAQPAAAQPAAQPTPLTPEPPLPRTGAGEPAVVQPAAAASAPQPAAQTVKPAAKPQAPAAQKPAVKKEQKPAVKKPPKAKRMSEHQAQESFAEAVEALRNKENDEGCRLLERVAAQAPEESRWREKATNLLDRRCD